MEDSFYKVKSKSTCNVGVNLKIFYLCMQNHIRKIREQNKLSLENVAESLGVTKAMISKLERGLLRVSDHWLDKFSNLYNCSVHDLIDDDRPDLLPDGAGQLYDNSNQVEFCSVSMRGFIDANQVGIVSYLPVEQRYTMRFSRPRAISFSERVELFCLTIKNNNYCDYQKGTQLVFANLNDDNKKKLLKNGSLVIVATKDKNGKEASLFLRTLSLNSDGIPHVVYRIKQGKTSYTNITNDILVGNFSISDLVKGRVDVKDMISLHNDINNMDARNFADSLQIENQSINLKAVLVKTIRDEV